MARDPEDDFIFDTSAITEEEWRDAQVLAFNIYNLAEMVRQFKYALDLLDHAQRQRNFGLPDTPATHWATIAEGTQSSPSITSERR